MKNEMKTEMKNETMNEVKSEMKNEMKEMTPEEMEQASGGFMVTSYETLSKGVRKVLQLIHDLFS